MLNAVGNVWAFVDTHDILIPVPIGYTKDCRAVFVEGIALEAARRFPSLLDWFGIICYARGQSATVAKSPDSPIIIFPVRSLDVESPPDSWQMPIDLELIQRSIKDLSLITLRRSVAMPIVGLQEGLSKTTIPMFRKLSDEFMLVRSRPQTVKTRRPLFVDQKL